MHLLLGATGLVGRELLEQLLSDGATSRLVVIARRPTGVLHPKLDERVFDLGEMAQHSKAFDGVDTIFCALGTTIKQAQSQEQFRVVDHDYPLAAARIGRERGVSQYLLVSALGANAASRVFYNRVKGETEDDLRRLAFPRLVIARPSLLLGDRTEFRLGERVASKLAFLMPPAMKPIEARDVARAMVALSKESEPDVRVVQSRELRAIAARQS